MGRVNPRLVLVFHKCVIFFPFLPFKTVGVNHNCVCTTPVYIVIYLYRADNETNIKPRWGTDLRWGWHFHSEGAAYVEHGYNEPLFILAVTHKENKIK